MNKSITVLGCGWLGLPLAIKLVANGWTVKGSTTSPEKLDKLAQQHIDPYLVQLSNLERADKRIFDSDALLINVPPGLRKQTGAAYLDQMQQLLMAVESAPIKYVVFISSTSVYPDVNSTISDTDVVDESSALYQSELLFAQSTRLKTTVIRFAGLIGPGREPARFFAGKQNVANGQAPVNLIHLDDCIGLIEQVLTQQQFGHTYHAAAPTHPTRAEFYTAAAKQADSPLPGFVNELTDWKLIDSQKIVQGLAYQFIHPDLLQLISG